MTDDSEKVFRSNHFHLDLIIENQIRDGQVDKQEGDPHFIHRLISANGQNSVK